jgi:hypothetical protein
MTVPLWSIMAAVSNDIAVTINRIPCNFREKCHDFERFAGRRRQLVLSFGMAPAAPQRVRSGGFAGAPPRHGVKSRTASAAAIL